jgi:hypothetical protein
MFNAAPGHQSHYLRKAIKSVSRSLLGSDAGLADDLTAAGGVAADSLDDRRFADVVGIDAGIVHAVALMSSCGLG